MLNPGLSGENGGEKKLLDGDTGDVDGDTELRGERHNQGDGEFELIEIILFMLLFSNPAGAEALRSHIEELPLIACSLHVSEVMPLSERGESK